MRAAGKSIIIITHKLNEVLELSDRVAVLRKGKYIDTVETKGATVESLTEMMVGEKVTLDINRTEPENAKKRIEMRGVTCRNKEGLKVLKEASFTAYSGEILGIAGISGSGQKELLESVAGLQPIESGEILYESPEGKVKRSPICKKSNHPHDDALRCDLWNRRLPDRQRCEPYDLHKYSRWTWIHCDHCCVDV